jgi:DNA-binding MarR family transcriptional regulator
MASAQEHPKRRRTDADGLVRWSETYAAAWFGLLETHKHLTAQLESELKSQHGLSLSGFELLTRLARAEDRTLRLTTLAEAAGLSLSRVSRVLDLLEARELVERRGDPRDTRAKNAWLTSAGLEVLQAAQETHFAGVERLFFDHVSDSDVAALARVFRPFRR